MNHITVNVNILPLCKSPFLKDRKLFSESKIDLIIPVNLLLLFCIFRITLKTQGKCNAIPQFNYILPRSSLSELSLLRSSSTIPIALQRNFIPKDPK